MNRGACSYALLHMLSCIYIVVTVQHAVYAVTYHYILAKEMSNQHNQNECNEVNNHVTPNYSPLLGGC